MLIIPRVYKVVGNRGCNSYILDADEGLVVIDVGYLGSEQAIINYLDAQINATPEDVAYIIITHARRNNAEAAPDLLAYCENAKLVVHRDELTSFRRVAFIGEDMEMMIIDAETSKIGGDITVIHTPGYTQGSITIIFQDSAFTGGSIYINPKGNFDLPTQLYDKKLLIQSLRKLIGLYKFENIFPSHGRYVVGNAHIKLKAFIDSLAKV